jgi:hypothetical protein
MASAFTRGVVSLAMVLAAAAVAAAQQASPMFVTTGHDTLRSLPGVEVAVEPLDAALERPGLTGAAIRTAVEAQLRAAGIPVYANQRQNPSAAKAYVYVDVTGVRIPDRDSLALSIQVQLRQTLHSLVTESNIVDAVSWDARTVIVVPASDPRPVRDTIGQFVNQFVRDWQRVH